jgi:hypothetical protein
MKERYAYKTYRMAWALTSEPLTVDQRKVLFESYERAQARSMRPVMGTSENGPARSKT